MQRGKITAKTKIRIRYISPATEKISPSTSKNNHPGQAILYILNQHQTIHHADSNSAKDNNVATSVVGKPHDFSSPTQPNVSYRQLVNTSYKRLGPTTSRSRQSGAEQSTRHTISQSTLNKPAPKRPNNNKKRVKEQAHQSQMYFVGRDFSGGGRGGMKCYNAMRITIGET